MKKFILSFFVASLFFGFSAQGMLSKLDYKGKLKPEAVAINYDGIWAIAGQKRKDNRNSDFYLVKWDDAKKDWVKKIKVAENIFDFATEGKVIASPDGTIIILSPIKRTLYKYAGGTLEKIYEFGGQKVNQIAATDINSIFYTEVQKVCTQAIPPSCSFNTYIRKWNPTEKKWDSYGKPLSGLWEKGSAGVDRAGYVGGTEWIRKNKKSTKISKVFYWNNTDFRWEPISISFNPNMVINEMAVAKKNDIWFHMLGAASKIELYHWDGKTLEKKVEREAPTPDAMLIDLAAIPGKIVGVDFGGNVYTYVYRKDTPSTRPVGTAKMPPNPPPSLHPLPKTFPASKWSPATKRPDLDPEIKKVYEQAPKNSQEDVLAAPPLALSPVSVEK